MKTVNTLYNPPFVTSLSDFGIQIMKLLLSLNSDRIEALCLLND